MSLAADDGLGVVTVVPFLCFFVGGGEATGEATGKDLGTLEPVGNLCLLRKDLAGGGPFTATTGARATSLSFLLFNLAMAASLLAFAS